jgi:hypothetical protein
MKYVISTYGRVGALGISGSKKYAEALKWALRSECVGERRQARREKKPDLNIDFSTYLNSFRYQGRNILEESTKLDAIRKTKWHEQLELGDWNEGKRWIEGSRGGWLREPRRGSVLAALTARGVSW